MKQIKIKSTEEQEQRKFFDYLALQSDPLCKLPYHQVNQGKRGYQYAKMLQRTGMKRGIPDVFIPIPKGIYHGFFIEFKVRPNKPTEDQEQWLDALTSQGYLCMVAYSGDEAIKAFSLYLALREDQRFS